MFRSFANILLALVHVHGLFLNSLFLVLLGKGGAGICWVGLLASRWILLVR